MAQILKMLTIATGHIKIADSASPVVRVSRPEDAAAWDAYILSHPHASVYHYFGWQHVIEKSYNHQTYYLIATSKENPAEIVGVLPLVHLKHFLFGNHLVSMPFFDSGGILANDEITARALIRNALSIGQRLKATNIELRHSESINLDKENEVLCDDAAVDCLGDRQARSAKKDSCGAIRVATKSHKVRMVLNLPDSPETLLKSFKAKLRSQIKKPMKEGLYSKVGGRELLDDFYRVFSENMRDLGSPVHSKELIGSTVAEFSENAKIAIVYKGNEPLACSLVIGFKQILANPWSSALRRFSVLSPNMLLYWTMLEYACQQGFSQFDFGRSSPQEGTYKFKKQWGADPHALHWQYFWLNDSAEKQSMDKSQYSKMIAYWKKLPIPVTRIFGPKIRKHIGL